MIIGRRTSHHLKVFKNFQTIKHKLIPDDNITAIISGTGLKKPPSQPFLPSLAEQGY